MPSISLAGAKPLLGNPLALWPESLGQSRDITLNLSQLEFVCPLDLAGLAAWSQTLRPGQRGEVILPSGGVATYLHRMKLLDILMAHGWDVPVVEGGPEQELAHKLLEVTSLGTFGEVEDLANVLPRLLAGNANDPKKLVALHFAFGELCDNAATHSGSAPFYVAAQRYTGATSGSRRLELAVADTGVGIPAHLRHNQKYAEVERDEQAVAMALKPGVTGTRDRRGYGFYDVLREIGDVASGNLIVYSGRGSAVVPFGSASKRRRFHPLPGYLPGTLIQVELAE